MNLVSVTHGRVGLQIVLKHIALKVKTKDGYNNKCLTNCQMFVCPTQS